MKDLILNFSWDKLISLPPTELLAFVVLGILALIVAGSLLGLLAMLVER
jgi:hypothetical protein